MIGDEAANTNFVVFGLTNSIFHIWYGKIYNSFSDWSNSERSYSKVYFLEKVILIKIVVIIVVGFLLFIVNRLSPYTVDGQDGQVDTADEQKKLKEKNSYWLLHHQSSSIKE
jgi:hypothetical protein